MSTGPTLLQKVLELAYLGAALYLAYLTFKDLKRDIKSTFKKETEPVTVPKLDRKSIDIAI